MATRLSTLLVASALCCGLVGCSEKHRGAAGTEPAAKKLPDDHATSVLYDTLVKSGSLYAGTVVSVAVTNTKLDLGDTIERGEIRFAVTRTIAGPPRKELTIPYWWLDRSKGGGPLTSDLIMNGPWPARPKVGEHLLLLIGDEEEAKITHDEYPLVHRWEAEADDPLVDDLELAVRFLAAKDKAAQDDLYRQLCRSRFRSVREFALDAAFSYLGHAKTGGYFRYTPQAGYDAVRQSHLALIFLEQAGPRLDAEERTVVTLAFASWFESGGYVGVTDAVKAACEDWYLKELSVRDDMRRPKKALEGLKDLVEARGMGVDGVIALFKKSGRAGLVQHVKDSDPAGDPEMEKLRKELLTKLDAP